MAPRPASHENTIGASAAARTARVARADEEFLQPRRVHREIRAVPARALNHPAAVGPRADKLGRILFDRRHDDEHVADERTRHLARLRGRRTDLNVHGRPQLVDQDRLAKQRFDFRADQVPLRIGRPRQSRLDGAPTPLRKVRAQPPPQVDRFSDVERAPVLVAQDIDARARRAPHGRSVRRPGATLPADPRRRAPGPTSRRASASDAPRMPSTSAASRRWSGASPISRRRASSLSLSTGAPCVSLGAPRLVPYNLRHECRRAQGQRSTLPFSCFIVTVSDTRTLENDASGRAIADLLTAAGHVVTGRTVVKDDPELVHSTIERHLADRGVQVIITTGGTGITSRDSTYEAISTLLEKRLDGFGELFRMLSYQQIGPAAMMSRACAGLVARRIVVALPGLAGRRAPGDGEAGDSRARPSRPAGVEISRIQTDERSLSAQRSR